MNIPQARHFDHLPERIHHFTPIMATLADELQNDFADSGDDGDQYDEDEEATAPNPSAAVLNAADNEVEMGDGDAEEDEDVGMDDADAFHDEAAEETEARIQRQRQAAIPKDMAAVTKFVASMQPALEVSHSIFTSEGLEFTAMRTAYLT